MVYAIAFVLFSIACIVLAFARHPIYGLYFYLGSIYVHPPSRWWGYMLPDLRWSLMSAVVAAMAIYLNRKQLTQKALWLSNPPAVLLTLYATLMVIQTPWALDQPTHVEGTLQFVKYMVAFWIVYRVADTKEDLRNVLIAQLLGCTLLGIYARLVGREGDRLDGVGGPGMDDANTLGMYLATGVIVGFGLLLTLKGWRRWVGIGLVAITLNGFVLANSRGAFLGLGAGVLVLGLCKARAHRRVFWSLVLVGVLGVSIIVDKVFIERMFTISDVTSEDEYAEKSARSRMAIFEAQVRMAIDYPMGAGFRGTATLSPLYLDREWLVRGGVEADAQRSSHNTFMTTLVEQGVLGAALFIALVLWLISRTVRLWRLHREGADPELVTYGATLCGALVVVIVAGSATDYLLAEVQFWLYAGLVVAIQLATQGLRTPVPGRTTLAASSFQKIRL